MEKLSIRQLRERLPGKSHYAERVVERAALNGRAMTKKTVYNVINGKSKTNEAAVRKILELIIEEEKANTETLT